MKKVYIIITLLLIPLLGFNQNIGAGASALYNLQSESVGIAARVSIFPNNSVSFVPQFSYYSLFIGSISEWTAGLSIELKVFKRKHLNYYFIAHGGYNNWSNPTETSTITDPVTLNFEGGVGISGTRCLRPFLEYRYNVVFQETHFQLGLLYIFGCKENTGGYRNNDRMKSRVKYPKYK
jgi:hypothetical protein|tara:strand:+ start:5841 stop:6377 length:537 start_codon:yes stop_codon:yes gene_type:complete